MSAQPSMVNTLTLSAVRVRRGPRTVLGGIDATFEGGRLTAVVGPNGAGKSTLLAVAAGVLVPQAGTVHLGGVPLAAIGRKALAQRRAYLPQTAAIEWPITVERVVALGLTPVLPAFGGLPAAWQPRIEQALAEHDLLALRHRPATELSGGELSRTLLARATVGDPQVLIVDEPTAGLDPRHALDAAGRLRDRARAGCAVVMAVHDLQLALIFADDVVAVHDGCIVAAGPIHDVLDEHLLGRLYGVPARITHDADGPALRFLDTPTSRRSS